MAFTTNISDKVKSLWDINEDFVQSMCKLVVLLNRNNMLYTARFFFPQNVSERKIVWYEQKVNGEVLSLGFNPAL